MRKHHVQQAQQKCWHFHRKYDNEVSNDRKYLKLKGAMVKEIYSIGFPAIIAQALNAGPQSLVISILRQFVLVIPVAFVFSNLVIAGTIFKSIIWFTFIIAEMLTALIGYFMLNRIVKNSLTFRAI